jgi:hypothetical protein
MSHSRMMAQHFGISILESDAKLLHERIQILITEAYNRGVQHEREACAQICLNASAHLEKFNAGGLACCEAIRSRGNA